MRTGLQRSARQLWLAAAPAAAAAAATATATAAGRGPWLPWLARHSSSSTTTIHEQPPAWSTDNEHEQHSGHSRRPEEPEFVRQREALLAAALEHVPQLGWAGGAAAAAAAAELGLSPAAAGMLGADAQFVQLFVRRCNEQLERELSADATKERLASAADLKERLRLGLELRLRMLEPVIASWPQALSLLAQPHAVPRTVALYADLADAVWHAAGDSSTDLSWYTKRALLAGAYSSTELFMLTDCSPGFADTRGALDRRLGEALELGKAAGDAAGLAETVGGAAGALLQQLSGVLGGQRPGPPL